MSLMWCDDFGSYGLTGSATLMRQGLYAAQGPDLVADPSPSGTGKPCNTAGSGTFEQTRIVFPGARSTVGIGFRLYLPNLFSTDGTASWAIRDVSNNTLCSISLRTTGAMYIANSVGTIIAETPTPVIVARSWQHIEFKVLLSATVGTCEIRVDGITKLAATGLALTNTQAAQLDVNTNSGGVPGSYYWRDFIMWDTLGSLNNDFFGTVSVIRMAPSSDVTLGGWTLTGGATGSAILSAVPPNDANFVAAAIPPVTASSFNLTDLPTDVSSVRALMTMVRAAKTDGGDGNLQVGLVSGASTANGANRPITPSFTYWTDIQELDPATSAPWTPASANAASIKMNRTT